MYKTDSIKQIMIVINVIQEYIQQGGDMEEINSYRQANGSYKGIVEYLSTIKGEMRKNNENGDS